MAQEVTLGRGGLGKVRSFWIGVLLTVVTVGLYFYFWYWFVNDELKDVGAANDDPNLATSRPASSLLAVTLGALLVIPAWLSYYNYGQRIRRAQAMVGVPEHERISPVVAFLLLVPGGLLIIPTFVHYWYVTKHQNVALRAAGERERLRAASAQTALAA
jgi:Domain of unknown function (DUF4234)